MALHTTAAAATQANLPVPAQARDLVPLDKLPAKINEAHAESERAIQAGVEHAFRAGALLRQAKAQVPHGKWLSWIKANCAFTPRTAQNYMALASLDAEKAKRVSHSTVREALRSLSKTYDLLTPAGQAAKLKPWTGPPCPTFDPATAPPTPPPTPVEPTTPAQRADDLIAQLDDALILDGEMEAADLRDAFGRRFNKRSFSNEIDPGAADGDDHPDPADPVIDLQRAVDAWIAETRSAGDNYQRIDFVFDLMNGDGDACEAILPVICAVLGIGDPWPGLTRDELNCLIDGREKEARRFGLYQSAFTHDPDLKEKLRAARFRDWQERAA
jgi:hypothetical protein